MRYSIPSCWYKAKSGSEHSSEAAGSCLAATAFPGFSLHGAAILQASKPKLHRERMPSQSECYGQKYEI